VNILGVHWIRTFQNVTLEEAFAGILLISFETDLTLAANATVIRGMITVTENSTDGFSLNGVSSGIGPSDWGQLRPTKSLRRRVNHFTMSSLSVHLIHKQTMSHQWA
jgi:hypothetical protein